MLETLQTIIVILIIPTSAILLLLILVQGGSGDLSSTFGGGGQLDSTLGVGASRKMGKITGWLSVVFLVGVLILAIPVGGKITDTPLVPGGPASVGPGVPSTDTSGSSDAPSAPTATGSEAAVVAPTGGEATDAGDLIDAEPVGDAPAQPEADADAPAQPEEVEAPADATPAQPIIVVPEDDQP